MVRIRSEERDLLLHLWVHKYQQNPFQIVSPVQEALISTEVQQNQHSKQSTI